MPTVLPPPGRRGRAGALAVCRPESIPQGLPPAQKAALTTPEPRTRHRMPSRRRRRPAETEPPALLRGSGEQPLGPGPDADHQLADDALATAAGRWGPAGSAPAASVRPHQAFQDHDAKPKPVQLGDAGGDPGHAATRVGGSERVCSAPRTVAREHFVDDTVEVARRRLPLPPQSPIEVARVLGRDPDGTDRPRRRRFRRRRRGRGSRLRAEPVDHDTARSRTNRGRRATHPPDRHQPRRQRGALLAARCVGHGRDRPLLRCRGVRAGYRLGTWSNRRRPRARLRPLLSGFSRTGHRGLRRRIGDRSRARLRTRRTSHGRPRRQRRGQVYAHTRSIQALTKHNQCSSHLTRPSGRSEEADPARAHRAT